MANKQIKEIAGKVNLMPIRAASFYYPVTRIVEGEEVQGYDFLDIYNIESESSYNIKPVIKPNFNNGGLVTLGYTVEVKLYISYNKFNDTVDEVSYKILDNLEYIRKTGFDFQLIIGHAMPANTTHLPKQINSTDGAWIDVGRFTTLSWEIESVEFRPRIIINLNGFVKNYSDLEIE